MDTLISLLTPKQKQFYESLKGYVEKKKTAPTIAELQKILHLSSPRAVTQYLDALERKGFIARSKYKERGIELRNPRGRDEETIMVPVFASAGCDNASIIAERSFDEYVCIAREMLEGRRLENVVSIRAIGDSMDEAGVKDGDYVLVEMTKAIYDNDLVVAIIDSSAVIKKIEFANNAIILKPVSSNPEHKPIIMHRTFQVFGKVIEVVRRPQKGDLEVVPVYTEY
jgi:repressor LexA